MTKERLEEIKDSIEFQMQIQQASGYKSRYDDLLIEEIDLYNEVIDLQNRIDKIFSRITLLIMEDISIEITKILNDLLEVVKGASDDE